jgi:hypothetical protein
MSALTDRTHRPEALTDGGPPARPVPGVRAQLRGQAFRFQDLLARVPAEGVS